MIFCHCNELLRPTWKPCQGKPDLFHCYAVDHYTEVKIFKSEIISYALYFGKDMIKSHKHNQMPIASLLIGGESHKHNQMSFASLLIGGEYLYLKLWIPLSISLNRINLHETINSFKRIHNIS